MQIISDRLLGISAGAVVIGAMASGVVSTYTRHGITEEFMSYVDTNNDGRVSESELKSSYENLGMQRDYTLNSQRQVDLSYQDKRDLVLKYRELGNVTSK